MDCVTRVGVIGGGAAARAFATACARAGADVVTAGPTAGRAELAQMADRELVLEVAGRIPAGPELYAALDSVVTDQDAVFAPSTDTLPLVQLCRATRRPGRVVGLRFIDGLTAELTSSLLTERSTTDEVEAFLGVLGTRVERAVDPTACGVNSALLPHLLAAIRMYDTGLLAADVDRTMRLFAVHPTGPLRLVDRIGLDVVAATAKALHGTVPPTLTRLIAAGRHFHDLTARGVRAVA